MRENSVDDSENNNNEDDKKEPLIKTLSTNKSNRLDTIKTLNSEDNEQQNLNINLTKQFSLKSQNSILSEFRDLGSRNSSIASASSNNKKENKDRSNTTLSRDCVLGPELGNMELKNEIMSLNPDLVLPPLLNKRTKFLKEMSYPFITFSLTFNLFGL